MSLFISRDRAPGPRRGRTALPRRTRPVVGRAAPEPLEVRLMPSGGLVAAYGFNEGSGATVADASGNGNTGTVSGAAWVTAGKYGGALSFNGTNSWVTVPDNASLDLTTGMTVEAWVDPSSLNGWEAVALKERPNGLSYALYNSDNTSKPPAGYINTGGSDINATGAANLPLNTWSYVATTYNGTSLNLYVNGALVTSRAASGSIVEQGGVLRIGGDSIWGEYFKGLIDEVRVYNVALNQSQVQTDMGTPVNSQVDNQPPTVSVTAPANNATVAATVAVSANASDLVAVANVQFQLDGSNLGAPVTAAPYTVSWDTTQATNGAHTLTAVATNVGGLSTTSSPVQVTVSNAVGSQGTWSSVMNWPLVAINQALLDNGTVLMWDGGPSCIGSTSATIYNPATQTFSPVPVPTNATTDNDIFCSGVTALADGRIFVAGGHDCTGQFTGANTTNIFDPATGKWTAGPTMAYHRWYPTATTLADGRVLITAGSQHSNTDYVSTPEIYDPVTNTIKTLNSSANLNVSNYPFMFVLPNGNVLQAGSDEGQYASQVLNVANQSVTTLDPTVVDGGSAVEYQPGKFLKAGASDPENDSNSAPSAATAYVLDTTQQTPKWQQTASMSAPRSWLDLTVLPDGNVLATGGSKDLGGVDPGNADYSAEEWSPTTQTWTTLASMQVPRLYHSTALLLPDGRVLVAGGGENYVNNDNYPSAQLFSPAYLSGGPRPSITSAPATVSYGSNFFVQSPDGASIASVSLIRAGAVTHSVDMGQSFQNLSFQQTSGGLTIQAPANSNLATPGYYMLFLVNSKGVPSVASFVRLPVSTGDTQAPTSPTNLAAAGGLGSVALSWTASTDNVGVAGYDVYRSTTSGFTPSAANLVGQAAGTSYNDAVGPGTYYYLVAAYDAAGNISAPSNQAIGISTTDTQAPTSPTNLTATGGIGAVALLWSASTDNVGVAGYDVYRSTTSGFTPSASNLVGQTAATSYNDAVSAGTYYYLVAAYDAAGNVSGPSNQATGISTADTLPPTVAITSPTNGVTVSGAVNVTAAATDNVAVASVQFQLDGANLGAPITTAPYTDSWNTAGAANGGHTLTAVAVDTSGNKATSAPVTVTVNNTSLVASYSFSEGGGTTTADGSGNGNTGTLSNAAWTTSGKSGDALTFNGTNSAVVANDSTSLHLTTGMTLEAWVDPTSLSNSGGNWCAAVAKEHLNSSNDIAYALYAAAGTNTPPAVHILVNGQDYGAQGASALTLNTWTFLAATYDGKTLKMYVNGGLVGSKSITGKITVTTNPLKIGGDWSNEMFTGTIDSVRVDNLALTQSQIQSDMAAPPVNAAAGGGTAGTRPAAHTWTGADGALWSDGANWIGGAPTEPGAAVIFPAGASNLSNINDLAGVDLGSVLFTGGGYTIGGNRVRLAGGVSTGPDMTGVDTFNAEVALVGDLTVSVADAKATVALDGVIGGAPGLSKAGAGRLVLSGANTYLGTTRVEAGVLDVQNPTALGLTSGATVVAGGAALDVEGGISLAEPLTLLGSGPDAEGALNSVAGANLWTGAITLGTADAAIGVVSGSTLTLRGVLGGDGGLTKVGLGFLVEGMFSSNTYAGATTVTAGSVLLDTVGGVAVPGALVIDPSPGSGAATVDCGRDDRTASSSPVTVDEFGVLDLLNHSITFGSLRMTGGTITTGDRGELDLGGNVAIAAETPSVIDGHVSLGRATRTVTVADGGLLIISASIDGSGGLVKQGGGQLVLSGSDAATGTTTVAGGTLTADGTLNNKVVVEPGGTLDGSGTVGSVMAVGGTVRSGDGSGSLTVIGNIAFSAGSTLSAVLNGPPDLNGAHPLTVGGRVRLGGSVLRVAVGSAPTPGEMLTLIRNEGAAPVSGRFAGLPEGTILMTGGHAFRISYAGGNVVLTDLTGSSFTTTAPAGPLTPGRTVVRWATLSTTTGGADVPTAGSPSLTTVFGGPGDGATSPNRLTTDSTKAGTATVLVQDSPSAVAVRRTTDSGAPSSRVTILEEPVAPGVAPLVGGKSGPSANTIVPGDGLTTVPFQRRLRLRHSQFCKLWLTKAPTKA